MRWADRALALTLLAFAGTWFFKALSIPFPSFARISRVGPAHYPIGLSIIMAVLALILLMQTFRRDAAAYSAEAGEEEAESRNPTAVRDLIMGFIIFLVYIIAVNYFGFLLSSALFIVIFTLVVGRHGWLATSAAAVIIPGALWAIFAFWLRIPLPKGPWGF